jgi:hypothetical protein
MLTMRPEARTSKPPVPGRPGPVPIPSGDPGGANFSDSSTPLWEVAMKARGFVARSLFLLLMVIEDVVVIEGPRLFLPSCTGAGSKWIGRFPKSAHCSGTLCARVPAE